MNDLSFWLEEKALDEEGRIEGVAAGYGNVDLGGDLLAPGALTKSLGGRSSIPMLLFHDQRQPVGVWEQFSESSKGLKVKGRFAMSTTAGREAHALAKDGALAGLSIGYKTLKERVVGAVRELLEIKLFEISLVAVPMNERATVMAVKTIELKDRLAAGDRLTEREWEDLLRKGLGLSNAEAERAVRLNLKGQGEPGDTVTGEDTLRRLHAAVCGAAAR